jgi:DNA-binding Xre family transcriptional regulator
MMNVTDSILTIIKEKGISQKELAKSMGVSPAALSKCLRNGNMRLHTLASICYALNIKPKIIFERLIQNDRSR